jgi:hypothetical protein
MHTFYLNFCWLLNLQLVPSSRIHGSIQPFLQLLGIVLNWLGTRTALPLPDFQEKVYIGKTEEFGLPFACFRNAVKIIPPPSDLL